LNFFEFKNTFFVVFLQRRLATKVAVSGVITAGFELKPPPYPLVCFRELVINRVGNE